MFTTEAIPTSYDSQLDCGGKDSGKDECWSDAVKIGVPVFICLAFFILLIVQFLIWPWTSKCILCFFGEESRPQPYLVVEDVEQLHDVNVKMFSSEKDALGQSNFACSSASVDDETKSGWIPPTWSATVDSEIAASKAAESGIIHNTAF